MSGEKRVNAPVLIALVGVAFGGMGLVAAFVWLLIRLYLGSF